MMKPAAASLSATEGFLRGLPLFNGVSEPSLNALARASVHREMAKGSYLFFQSDSADSLYVVRSGAIAIVLASPDGRELVINELHAGDCFGELALLTGGARSTGATARVNSVVLSIPRDVFSALLDREPSLSRQLLATAAERLQKSSEREGALAFLDAQARLARVLLVLDDGTLEKGYLTISQDELAQRAALTRQTVAKALGRWRRKGWLITGRGHIVLLDHARLGQLAQQPE